MVIARQQHGMVRQRFQAALDAQVQHEGGAGETRLRELCVAPARAVLLRDQSWRRMGEVAVDDHGVRRMALATGEHGARPPVGKFNPLGRRAQTDLRAKFPDQLRHGDRDRPAAANRMVELHAHIRESSR